jgi:hypothetical protein
VVSDSCSSRLCDNSASVCATLGSPVVVEDLAGNKEFPLAVCTPCASSGLPLRRNDDVRFSAALRSASFPSLDVDTSLPASACILGAYDGN